jgi:hypothetical protein
VAAVSDLPVGLGNTQCCFSPDESLILTGVGATQGAHGHLAIYDAVELTLVKRLGAPGSVVPVTWHPKLNQIAFGCGDRKQGSGRILYDPELSDLDKGIIPAVGRRPRQENEGDFTINVKPRIYAPNALPMYKEDVHAEVGKKRVGGSNSTKAKIAKLFKPDQGAIGIVKGSQGKLGTGTGGSLLTQYLLKNQGILKRPEDEDVREAILRHHDNEDDMKVLTSAYQTTQPSKIYLEDEENDQDSQNDS